MQKILDWYLKFYPTIGAPLKRRVAIHSTYWVVWGLFSILSFIAPSSIEHKLIITGFLMLQGITVFYGITYFALPNLISPKRFMLGMLVIVIIYCLDYVVKLEYYQLVLKYTLYAKNGYGYKYAQMYVQKGLWGMFSPQNFFYEVNVVVGLVALPFLLKFSRTITEYSVKVTKLSKERADLEIDFLRTQLNPHFLLNSLNNIYSQVISKDETAGDSIIVLSDLMKYILYKSGDAAVELDKEINFLRNYVDLEKLKGSRFLKIQFSQEGEMKGYTIAPLILINYVENAFKHGGNREGKVSLVDININFINEKLSIRIENDFVEKVGGSKKIEGGIGIANTRKRLELLYPNRHNLTVKTENNKFLVELWILLARE
jgi:two-component system, LytTR family, sensor kinase